MMIRTVVLGMLWLAPMVVAAEPPKTPAPDAKQQNAATQNAAKLEADAKRLGLSVWELKRLRELGFTDPEILNQLKGGERTARQLITEREVIDAVAQVVAGVNAQVNRMPAAQQATEREALLKAGIAQVRRNHRMSREEMRRILASTSLLTPDELKRVLGTSFFNTDELKRVLFSAEETKP